MTDFLCVPEFERDFQKLAKKFVTLTDDFEIFKAALVVSLPGTISGTFRISGLGGSVTIPVFKVKHFRCRALQGKGCKSGIRIIYAYHKDEDKVLFLDIYYKGDRANEDRTRILSHMRDKESL